ncbi:MAG: hypothetical protein ABR585_02735 [Gemmatimonadaceae bacterium]
MQPPASEVPIPVKPKTDSATDTTRLKTDTIKAPIGRFADPALYEIGPQYEWNRAQLFATGALNLAELLDRVPEVTTFRSGWLSTPQTAAFNGAFSRIRIFYDGVEIVDLDNRTGDVLDLSTVQIWTLEHVSIERSAWELRVYLRSWRADNTTPYTRADIATGNEDTNLYRGFYGKRFDNGGVLQFGAQQYGVTSPRFAGTGDGLSLLSRVGIAKRSWSLDGFVIRTHTNRSIQRAAAGRSPVLGLDATNTSAYVRAAVGGVASGPWLQLTLATLGFKGTTAPDRSVGATAQADTLERKASEVQYDLSAGLTRGPLRLQVEDRTRALNGKSFNSVSGRADIVSRFAVLSGFAEHDGRGTTDVEGALRFQPLRFVAFSGSVARATQSAALSGLPSATHFRGEAALRLFGPWLAAGLVNTNSAGGPAPIVYDTLLLATPAGRSTAGTASLRGPLGRGFGIDAWVIRWKSSNDYRPQYQSRAEINFASNFLNRFPRGEFELRVAGTFEYRGRTTFPLLAGDAAVSAAKTLSGLVEIRIMRAVLSYQQRNILAYPYEIIPGFEMPRVLAIYGVRWDFWN